ncbi:hypothetical protein SHKM778_69250 [Streptomyces sp. KM77-8]|uniref:Uncharacterized protein n=1 Tax=Streptomyces haneummycinicus TaxID=3074435 RepID=A0AAT9HSW4_9ACTN
MVGDDVQQHPDAEPPGGGDQQVELGEVAEDRVDAGVVGDVVAVVVLRRGVEGAQPDPVHPELLQIRQPGPDTGKIADAVAGAVEKAADVDLIDHRVAPPVVPVHPIDLSVSSACYACMLGSTATRVSMNARKLPGSWPVHTGIYRGTTGTFEMVALPNM